MGTDAHVCLLLFSSLIALTAEGYPTRNKIMPSPIRRYRPSALAHPHRKLSRPWLIKLQEELWKDGPSGDGPGEDGRSSLISPVASQEDENIKTDYKISSPSAEDIISYETEPFPTIIDTIVEESSSFPEEFVLRTSLLYEGPSSLLNSFIFRPNLPYSSLSSIKTPVIEESSKFLNVIPSWMDESTSSRIMSSQQALSETVFSEFFIVTAISATNIETAQMSGANISFPRLPSELPNNFTEKCQNVTNDTQCVSEVPSLSDNISIPTFSVDFEKSQFHTEDIVLLTPYPFTDTFSVESTHPTLETKVLLSSNIDISLVKNKFYSKVLTDISYVSTYSHSDIFYKTSDLSPSTQILDITDLYFDQTQILDNSFSTQILYDVSKTFYTKMPFKSLLFSNVQATFTVAEYDSKSDIFITPASIEHKLASTSSLFLSDVQDINLSLKSSKFENLASYVSASFFEYNDVISVTSYLPIYNIMTVEKMSQADIETHLKTISQSGEFKEQSISEFEFSYPIFSSIRTFLFDDEINFNKYNSLEEFKPFVSKEMNIVVKDITPPIPFTPSYTVSDLLSRRQTFTFINNTHIFDRESEINEITSDGSQEGILLASLNLLTNSEMLDASNVLTSIPYLTEQGILYSKLPFTELLSSMGKQSYSQHQAMTRTVVSVPDIISINDNISGELEVLSQLPKELPDASTHHVTVRSLNGMSYTDISESVFLSSDFPPSHSYTDISTVSKSNLTLISETVNESGIEKISLSSNIVRQTEWSGKRFRTTDISVDYLPFTETIISEFSSCCFEKSMPPKNSEMLPSLDSLSIENKHSKIARTDTFSGHTLEELSHKIYTNIFETSLYYSDTEPTRTFSNVYDKSMKKIVSFSSTEMAFTLNDKASENKHIETIMSISNDQIIESSFPPFSDFSGTVESDKVTFSTFPLTDIHAALDTSYHQKKSSDAYLRSSPYTFSEHFFHSFNGIVTEHLSTDDAYSDSEIDTRTISKKIVKDIDSKVTVTSSSDFVDLISDQNNIQVDSVPIRISHTSNPYSDSIYITPEVDTEIVDFSYHFYPEFSTLSIHYRSTLEEVFDTKDIFTTSPTFSSFITEFLTQTSNFPILITSHTTEKEYISSAFETMIDSEISRDFSESVSAITPVLDSEGKFYFTAIKTENQLDTADLKSSLIYDLHSETLSKMYDSPFTLISSYFSEKDSDLYKPLHESTSSLLAATWEDSILTGEPRQNIPSRHIKSFIDYGSILSSKEESQFDLSTTDFSWFKSIPSEDRLKYFEISPSVIDSFSLAKELISSDQTPYQDDDSDETLYRKFTQVNDLELTVKPSSSEYFNNFNSETISKFFPVPEITPTKTVEETASPTQKLIDVELHSKIYSGNLESSISFIPDLTSEQDTDFYQHTPELTPSISTTAFEQSSCQFPSCPVETKIVTFSSNIVVDPFQNKDLIGLVSPTVLPDLGNYKDKSTISLGTVSLNFPLHSITENSQRITESKRIKTDYSGQKSDLNSEKSYFTFKHTGEYSSTKLDVKNAGESFSVKTMPATPFVPTKSDDDQLSSRLKTNSVGVISSSIFHQNDDTLVPSEEISTPGYDTEMASVLAISSFFGFNSSRNASSGFENSGISEDDWSKSEVKPTPSFDLTLFKDNNYWILTVLETPMKGHLPENFSHTLEVRLANAYSEAFRQRYPKQERSEPIIVKILSLTNDLLLSQLNIVYVVEKGGILLPAEIASDLFNFLRHEQLREFLGLYAILKAKPYRPDELPETKAVSSTIPVVTIVCSILGFLLLLFCCFCVYCRCCRPKQANDASPTSSASGSLQRSLAKHGQHNRKHLFQEMAHHLTSEIVAAHRKIESPAKDLYYPEKELPIPGKKLPSLPTTEQAEAIDKAARMLNILENKDASISPITHQETQKDSREKNEPLPDEASTLECKKSLPKPKKRKKTKEGGEKKSSKTAHAGDKRDSRPSSVVLKKEKQIAVTEERRTSPDSGTSSRHTSSSPTSVPEKMNEEAGSDGSNTELLPPVQDLIAKSKAESEAAVADTQDHLSRVRQRISEILDDAFALANGRKFYGSMRSKKIDPATDMFPRYGSLRSQSAAECPLTRHEEGVEDEIRRPISEGAQNLLGTITDEGQLITRPPPKLVWDHTEFEDSTPDKMKHPEVTEAHNKHVNFFPFQQQSKQQPSSSTSFSLPMTESQHKTPTNVTSSIHSTVNVLREVGSEKYTAHSSKIHPAAIDQYDEIDIVSALKEGEPVIELIQAIKDELQKFSGSVSGTHNNESNA